MRADLARACRPSLDRVVATLVASGLPGPGKPGSEWQHQLQHSQAIPRTNRRSQLPLARATGCPDRFQASLARCCLCRAHRLRDLGIWCPHGHPCHVGPRGPGAADRHSGRKRHIAVDATGLILDVVIIAASVRDRVAARQNR
jgi:hypothetical protein